MKLKMLNRMIPYYTNNCITSFKTYNVRSNSLKSQNRLEAKQTKIIEKNTRKKNVRKRTTKQT